MKLMQFTIILSISLIIGCTTSPDVIPSIEKIAQRQYCDQFGYCLALPSYLKQAVNEDYFPVFYVSGDDKTNIPLGIDLYHSSPSCSQEVKWESPPMTALGVSEPQISKDDQDNIRMWGRVDFYELYFKDAGIYPKPLCTAYAEMRENDPNLGMEGGVYFTSAGRATYAFCSQKDEKAITICINQQTDDKELAEEIFGSFRWTE